MNHRFRSLLFAALAYSSTAWGEIVISELMYHPQSENSAEEYIELFNSGSNAVDLSGWRITSGVRFTVPPGTNIAPGGYLVIAADQSAFTAKYPGVTNVVAGWSGELSNSRNTVRLVDQLGSTRDEVSYADDGDWAERQRDNPPDFGHRGWDWHSDADGFGKSLELINVLFDNNTGQNWAASLVAQGTPGSANSVASGNIAPVISDAQHFPLVPRSSEAVTITCRVADDHGGIAAVQLFYRNDGAATFTTTPMFDDGAHGDALPNDGIFGAIIPPRANRTIVEFYISANDSSNLGRTWPAPARDYTGVLVQSQNALYQVDDTVYAGAMPIYRLVLRAADRSELTQINTNSPRQTPFPFNPGESANQTASHAKFNATFISQDGTGTKLRYLCGARNRGNGSRSLQPQSLALSFLNANRWNDQTGVNLNSQYTPYQLFGSALFRKAGLAMAESRGVQLRVNAVNPASATGAPAYGFYVCNQRQDSQFADHHFPLDSSGNMYRGTRNLRGTTAGGTRVNGADLGYVTPAPNETLSQVELYKLNYSKQTNSSEDDWSDLIGLTRALAKGQSDSSFQTTYDADYVESVRAWADVTQWMRFFAANTFADNIETNIANGNGDDFCFYFGRNDPRAKLIPYDLDSIVGQGSGSNPQRGIFRMTISDMAGNPPTPLNAFMRHPEFAPVYYAELKRLLDGAFNPAEFNPLVDATIGGLAPATIINSMKSFNAARHAFITSQVPLALSITAINETNGSPLTPQNGYPRTTNPACQLIGFADAVNTRNVRVNGVAATWSAWEAKWTANSVALAPGVNRLLIQAFDISGVETDRAYIDVWYDNATQVPAGSAIVTNTTWTAAGGPYRVSGTLTVAAGATLTIEPGANVWLGEEGVTANLIVAHGGRLIAEGTEASPIRFMPPPGAPFTWGGIIINGGTGTPESRISHAYIEGNSAIAIDVNGADVVLDHLQFGNTARQYLSLDGASFLVSNCIFPSGTAEFELVHGTLGIKTGGRGIIRDCFFGKTRGYNDTLDFTGGNRPGPILQFINNVCIGSDDDILDLDGTDAWVEGNIFMHVHRNGSPDSASAVSSGNNGSATSQITVVGNLFYDIDQVAMAKQGNFITLLNNTVIDQNGRGSQDAVTAVVNLADDGTTEGAGMYLEGNIIHSATALARNYNPARSVVTLNNNILPMPWSGPGGGNSVVDPLLVDVSNLSTPTPQNFRTVAAQLRAQLALRSNSPARGTGPNGSDKGGIRPLGVSLSGAPVGTTNQTAATLTVGTLMTGNGIPTTAAAWPSGSGWTHYKWRLNGSAWSAETPITTPIRLDSLPNGSHTVDVIGKNDAAFYQDHPDFGPNARLTSATWIVDTAYVPPDPSTQVRINEVLAKNTEAFRVGNAFPDLIELYNPATAAVDLSGWGLTDNPSQPFKYTFPAGSIIAPGQHLVIHASSSSSVPQPRANFGLKDEGDTVTLTRSAAAGGGLADRVEFGAQLPDYSIGRGPDGAWTLCRPTFGSANILAPTAPISGVRINEWLTDASVLAGQDFVELINTATLPADLGLGYLTDHPNAWPHRHQIRQLTFIAPGGYLSFKADNDPEQGPDHLNFKLAPEQGEIGLFSQSLTLVDNIVYGPQSTDVSQGRSPNGSSTIAFFTQPTPGGPNPGPAGVTTSTINLIDVTKAWKYSTDGTDHSASFFSPTFDDSAWPSGAQLLYIEPDTLTSPSGFTKQTLLPGDPTNGNLPYNAYYFRTRFNYSGPLTGVTLRATVMIDEGAVFYLNGKELIPENTGQRLRMPSGPINFFTIATAGIGNANEETLIFDASALQNGENVLCVAVHQEHVGSVQTSSDIVFGLKLDALVTNSVGLGALALNEVLTINATLQNPDGSYAGWIELYNPTNADISLADASLSDNPAAPRKFVFPPGTVVPAGDYYVVHCNPFAPANATNTGFAFNPDGGSVLLFDPLPSGGGLHSSVAYGRQIPDFAVGRSPNSTGPFVLCVPTRGAINTAAATSPLTSVRINEWLAAPGVGPDFLELYNTGPRPVALGGAFLTDQLTNKTKSLIPALSFIGTTGAARWQTWIADGDNVGTPGHVTFELAASGEAIGLYTASGIALDTISFGPQVTGLSGGRYPDGTSAIFTLLSTPGAPNRLPATDTDGDDIPDAWEIANGLDPNNPADAMQDADGDGQSNLAEYLAGTNPRSPSDALRASLFMSQGSPVVRFTAVAGKSYTVQYKSSLSDPDWTKLTDIEPQPATGELEVHDTTLTDQAQRFYRVITPAVP